MIAVIFSGFCFGCILGELAEDGLQAPLRMAAPRQRRPSSGCLTPEPFRSVALGHMLLQAVSFS